ncbi:uncharacterized protein [Musca autumnalis]|uniref:uncharacterized protein n=1 Tax=Musca autumnalis TaxID=221902 RepID=UPI003CEF7346
MSGVDKPPPLPPPPPLPGDSNKRKAPRLSSDKKSFKTSHEAPNNNKSFKFSAAVPSQPAPLATQENASTLTFPPSIPATQTTPRLAPASYLIPSYFANQNSTESQPLSIIDIPQASGTAEQEPSSAPKEKINNSPTLDRYNYNAQSNTALQYPKHHPGPFHVLVTSETPVSSRRKNCELHVFAKLESINIEDNYVCKCIGFNTFRLTFNNYGSANSFSQNQNLSTIGLKAEIPERFVQKYYVIKNVPTSIMGLTIKESITSNNDIDVISVYRFLRKNEQGQSVPTETVKIGIICDGVPQEILMCGARIIPDLYIPPIRQCKNCGRLGHIAMRCRSKKRCLKCGKTLICPNECCYVTLVAPSTIHATHYIYFTLKLTNVFCKVATLLLNDVAHELQPTSVATEGNTIFSCGCSSTE